MLLANASKFSSTSLASKTLSSASLAILKCFSNNLIVYNNLRHFCVVMKVGMNPGRQFKGISG